MTDLEITVKVGDNVKVRRPRLLEKRAKIVKVKEIRPDGTILAYQSTRQARGGGWVLMTTVVLPNEILEIVRD